MIFTSNEKIHLLHIETYYRTKNNVLAEVTFNNISQRELVLSNALLITFHIINHFLPKFHSSIKVL